jgi:TIGR03009 family protein
MDCRHASRRAIVAAFLVAFAVRPAAVLGQAAAPPAAAPQPPPAAAQPPALSPQEQAALDRLLAAWEARSAAVKTWSCTFHKWEYNAWSPADEKGGRLAFAESGGELKYAAPDKGLFRIKESKQWNPQTRRYELRGGEQGEHWVCNGESIYEFRHADRQLHETKLPPEMRGKAISDGPLPFVFGAKAETLKKRYWMRIITPPQVTDQIWLEALPRFQADAANFSKVELILRSRDLMPFAIQIYKPGGRDQDVYQFDPAGRADRSSGPAIPRPAAARAHESSAVRPPPRRFGERPAGRYTPRR